MIFTVTSGALVETGDHGKSVNVMIPAILETVVRKSATHQTTNHTMPIGNSQHLPTALNVLSANIEGLTLTAGKACILSDMYQREWFNCFIEIY